MGKSWCTTCLYSKKHSYTWTIKNFSLTTQNFKTGKPLVSSPFTLGEKGGSWVWRLTLYPGGETEETKDYLSVTVILLESSYTYNNCEFELSIIDSKQVKRIISESEMVVMNEQEECSQKDLIRRDILLEEKNEFLTDGNLILNWEVTIFSWTSNDQGMGNTTMFKIPENHLSDDLEKLLKSQEYSDVVLVANGREYHAHKAVLAARSPVFAAMFKHEMVETKQSRVEIKDVDSEVLKEMLFFVYTGKAPSLQNGTLDLLAVANKYALDTLKVLCEEALSSKYSIDAASELLTFADLHTADQLKSHVIDFIVLHAAEVMETAGWKTMAKHHPSLKWKGNNVYFIQRDELMFLVISKKDVQEFIALQFLECFYMCLRNFCGNLSQDVVTKNSLLVFELMGECLENGYIQSTNTEQLRAVVYSDPVVLKSEIRKPGLFGLEVETVPGSAASGPLVHSRSQQAFKHDEVYIDVVEKLTVHIEKQGSVACFILNGSVRLKSFISQTHSLFVSLNDGLLLQKAKGDAYETAVHLDKCYFADCVNSVQFEKKCSFVVTPPQGEVPAMQYQMESSVPPQLPFNLTSSIQESSSSRDCDLTLRLSCDIPANTKALNINIHIPVPSATRNVMQQFTVPCSAEFCSSKKKILWKIGSLPGNSEIIAKFKLVEALQCAANKMEIGPVALDFEVSNFVISGLFIRNVKAHDSSGKQIPMRKWVRYVTHADSYVFKL